MRMYEEQEGSLFHSLPYWVKVGVVETGAKACGTEDKAFKVRQCGEVGDCTDDIGDGGRKGECTKEI